jgi:hypothetical protein
MIPGRGKMPKIFNKTVSAKFGDEIRIRTGIKSGDVCVICEEGHGGDSVIMFLGAAQVKELIEALKTANTWIDWEAA